MSRRMIRPDTRKAMCPLLISVLVILAFGSPAAPASAKLWASHDATARESDVLKPVDPVFINEIVGIDVNGTDVYGPIRIDRGEEWRLFYPLEAGKRYHIFLVGDWINNGTEPLTDYDVTTYDPDGNWISDDTESAGLPEQVANDERHQYFVPEKTGNYEFRILNDPRDSKNNESAVFMAVEHIETNVRYTRTLEGRDRENDEELLNTGWAYEFNTSSPVIRVFIDVPPTLDMYEARLYAMADPAHEVGYLLNGLGVPSGDLFNNFTDGYGGFNTSCKGDRNPEAMASCEHSGEDMAFVYEAPKAANETSNVFYYLALIAEYGEGEVEFYVQTDFSPPNITLVDPPEMGYAGEETRITASIDGVDGIQSAWVEYSDDGKTWTAEALIPEGDVYVCDLPPFPAGAYVNYTVHAKNGFGTEGAVEAGFPVKNNATLDCSLAASSLRAGHIVEVNGRVSTGPANVTLRFTNGDFNESVEAAAGTSGAFSYSYAPRRTGEWSLQALYGGGELDLPASSDILNFTVESMPTSVVSALSSGEVKQNQPINVSGTVTPPVQGLAVEVTFASSASYHVETVSTDAAGGFSCSFVPHEAGTWAVLTRVRGDGFLYAPSQSGLMEFTVVPLEPMERVANAATTMMTPPYQYLTLGLTGVGVALTAFKGRARLAPILPPSLAKRLSKGKGKRRSGRRGQSYRRNKR